MSRILLYSNTSAAYQKKTAHYLIPIPNSKTKKANLFKELEKRQNLIKAFTESLKTAQNQLKLLCPHPPDQVTVEVDSHTRFDESVDTISTARCKLCESLVYNITQHEGDKDLP